jgi:hypothetical protein
LSNELRYRATIKDDVSGPLGKLQDRFGQLKAQGAQGFFTGVGAAATLKAFSLADRAISSTVDWLAEGVAGAREEEIGIAKLGASLRANVADWDGTTAAIEKRIRAGMDLAFADDEQRDSLARLVAVTHDVDKAFEVQRTAMDLARFKGIGLGEATDALIKVEAGQYRMLKSLGIVLEEGATQTEALAAVQKVASGQAEAFMETGAGQAEEFGIKVEELGEKIGSALIPALEDGTSKAIGFLDALDEDSPMVLSDRTLALVDALSFLNPALEQGADAMHEAKDAIPTRQVHRFAEEVDDAGGSAKGFAKSLRIVADDAKRGRQQIDKLRDSAEDALDTFLDAALGPEELRLRLEGARDEMGENERDAGKLQNKIERFKDAGKPVGELQDDLRDLRGEILDNQRDVIETTGRLEALGKVPMGSTRSAIDSLIDKADIAEAWDLYRALNAIDSIGGSGGSGSGGNNRQTRDKNGNATSTTDGRGYASGGVLSAGSWGYVGENAMEKITALPGGGVAVTPIAGAEREASSGGVTVNLTVQTPALTPGAAQALADVLAPSITRWQQQRGL